MSLVLAAGLEKSYRVGEVTVPAIRGADFTIEPASFVSFVGSSGSGKSALLNMKWDEGAGRRVGRCNNNAGD